MSAEGAADIPLPREPDDPYPGDDVDEDEGEHHSDKARLRHGTLHKLQKAAKRVGAMAALEETYHRRTRFMCAPGERVDLCVDADDDMAHGFGRRWLKPEQILRVEAYFHEPRKMMIFDAWMVMACSFWTAGWYLQSIELFAVCFAIGFIPPSILIVLTANITLLKRLHKEFNLWYTCGNMLIFSACMPFICPHMSLGQVVMQIVGQLYSVWLYCVIDSVQVSRRFKLMFATWILGYWSSFYHYLANNEAPWAASPTFVNVTLPGTTQTASLDLNLLGEAALVNSIAFTMQQAWKILKNPRSATVLNLVPGVKWDPFLADQPDEEVILRAAHDQRLTLLPGHTVAIELKPKDNLAHALCR